MNRRLRVLVLCVSGISLGAFIKLSAEDEITLAVDQERAEQSKESKKNGLDTKDDGKKSFPKKESFSCRPGDSEFKFGIRLRIPEFFYGKNLNLLNDENPTDRVLYFRHTLDATLEYRYGRPKVPYDIVYAKMTIRNKGVWGDPESIAGTNSSNIRELGTTFGSHSHGIPLLFLWIRELWVQFTLNDVFSLPFCTNHTFTVGSFPFELGRGIALGAAYTVDRSDLGFVAEYGIDQYAFGALLSGEILKGRLLYDLYGAILDTKTASFGQTNAKIRAQQYFHRNDQARGFGVMNYLVAARLKWFPKLSFSGSTCRVEPYLLYNHSPEQRLRFSGDAKSDLVTIGIASESVLQNFEWGFDTAFNFGHQTVLGFDSNVVSVENRKGIATIVNTSVRQALSPEEPSLKSPLALSVAENQAIIDQSAQTSLENGKVIGENTLGVLINDKHRFTDGYVNQFRGSMYVFDMGYTIYKPDLKVCAGFGYASGDANPNRDEEQVGDSVIDGEYEGFISLQEVYSGTRVKSAFLMSGQGRMPRPLVFPSEEVPIPFSTSVSRFTNLVFVGGSTYWRPSWSKSKWNFNPNILAYWTDFTTPFFDAKTVQNSVSRFARNYLGLEINIFIEAEFIPDLRFFSVGSLFFPGSHYRDIKGRPLDRGQQSFLENRGKPGIINDRVPVLGDDTSYFFNIGLDYRY